MSDILTDLEQAIVTALKGVDGLQKVKTIEAGPRECLFTGEKLTMGYRSEELPAIAVSAQEKPSTTSVFTLGEERHDIPVALAVLARGKDAKAALAAAEDLWGALRGELASWRRSDNPLGANTWMTGNVSSSATAIDEKPYAFAMRTTEFTITKVVEIG